MESPKTEIWAQAAGQCATVRKNLHRQASKFKETNPFRQIFIPFLFPVPS